MKLQNLVINGDPDSEIVLNKIFLESNDILENCILDNVTLSSDMPIILAECILEECPITDLLLVYELDPFYGNPYILSSKLKNIALNNVILRDCAIVNGECISNAKGNIKKKDI